MESGKHISLKVFTSIALFIALLSVEPVGQEISNVPSCISKESDGTVLFLGVTCYCLFDDGMPILCMGEWPQCLLIRPSMGTLEGVDRDVLAKRTAVGTVLFIFSVNGEILTAWLYLYSGDIVKIPSGFLNSDGSDPAAGGIVVSNGANSGAGGFPQICGDSEAHGHGPGVRIGPCPQYPCCNEGEDVSTNNKPNSRD